MVKVNLIIDGSYLLYKNVFILQKFKSIQDLEDLLLKDYNRISKSYPFNKRYFVSDSKENNWRKQIYNDYKGKRKKDKNIDWDYVFKTYDLFKEKLRKKPNVKILEHVGLEGDDFISHIITTSNKDGYSNVLVASDGDLQQLLKFDLNDLFINFQWNYKFSDERLYLPKDYQLFLDKLINSPDNNIFSPNNDSEFGYYIESLLQQTKVSTIIPEKILFVKLVHGDTADNIPSIIKIKDKKYDVNGRGIGETGAESLYKLYKEINPEEIDFNSPIFIEKLIDVVLYYKKIKSTLYRDIIKENIIFNKKLIILDPIHMPDLVYENMVSHFNQIINQKIEYIPEIEENEEEYDIKNNIVTNIIEKDIDDMDTEIDDFWEL